MQSPRSLTEGSISHRLFEFAIPILLANVLQSLNGSVNSIWVGRFLGEAALTATANGNIIMFLLLSTFFGASMASTILIGQYMGARRLHEAKRVVGTSTTFSIGLAVVMTSLGLVFCEPLLVAMSTPANALPFAVDYMQMVFLALPSICVYTFVVSVLRGAGDAKTPLYFMMLSVALDICLNPLFIFGAGPIPAMGVAGSSFAMLLANAIALITLIVHLYRRKHPLCLYGAELHLLKPDWRIVGTLITKGVPMALQLMVMSTSMMLMITLVNRFGVDTAAAFGAAFQVWNYIQMPAFAIGMAVSTMAAQNVGAQKWDRVAATARTGLLFNLVLTGSLVILTQIFAHPALGLFLPAGSPAIDIGVHMNHIVGWSFVLFALSMTLFGVVRATGAVVVPLLIMVFALLLVRFPFAEIFLDDWGADAIWWSFPVSSAVSILLAMLYYKYGGWRSARMIQPAQAAGVPPASASKDSGA
jgi:putative MATE family efflux protein